MTWEVRAMVRGGVIVDVNLNGNLQTFDGSEEGEGNGAPEYTPQRHVPICH